MGDVTMQASPYVRLRNDLATLGLDTMAASLDPYMKAVAAGELDFCSALHEMASAEVEQRERTLVARKIRSSGFVFATVKVNTLLREF